MRVARKIRESFSLKEKNFQQNFFFLKFKAHFVALWWLSGKLDIFTWRSTWRRWGPLRPRDGRTCPSTTRPCCRGRRTSPTKSRRRLLKNNSYFKINPKKINLSCLYSTHVKLAARRLNAAPLLVFGGPQRCF